MEFSFFNKTTDTKPFSKISLPQLINHISTGFYSKKIDALSGLEKKQYQNTKRNTLPAVTISGEFSSRKDTDLVKHSGLICLDFDNLQNLPVLKEKLKTDEFITAMFTTPSKKGLAVIIKIPSCDEEKHALFYQRLESYFLETYGMDADPSCKNISRLRYVSHDPEAFYKESAKKWNKSAPINKKQKEPPAAVYVQRDLDFIFEQISQKRIDLTQDSYEERLSLLFALAKELGGAGRRYAHLLCENSHKYDFQECDAQFNRCLNNELKTKSIKQSTLGSLIHVAKKSGVKTMTRETSIAALYAKTNKIKGVKPQDAIDALFEYTDTDLEKSEAAQIFDQVYNSDFNRVVDLSIEEQIEEYIRSNYDLKLNEITNRIERDGRNLIDKDLHEIWFDCKKVFKEESNITHTVVFSIAENICPQKYNPFQDFINANSKRNGVGLIDILADTINSPTGMSDDGEFSPTFVRKFVRKWYLGIAASLMGETSPLMLVLTGGQGSGKTEFFRRLLPDALKDFYSESKLDRGKDDELLLCTKLIVLDDEYSGKSKKESGKMKDILSKKYFDIRPPYGRQAQRFKRVSVLAGTSNDTKILVDPTGNRRVIPIEVESIDHDLYNSINKTELLIEAVNAINKGESFELSKEDVIELNNNTKGFEDVSLEFDFIDLYYRPVNPSDTLSIKYLSTGEIVSFIEKATQSKINKRRLVQELKSKGFEEKSIRLKQFNDQPRRRWQVVLLDDYERLTKAFKNNESNENAL